MIIQGLLFWGVIPGGAQVLFLALRILRNHPLLAWGIIYCWGLNLGHLCESQASSLLCCDSDPARVSRGREKVLSISVMTEENP